MRFELARSTVLIGSAVKIDGVACCPASDDVTLLEPTN
jgi:hypothetical protein